MDDIICSPAKIRFKKRVIYLHRSLPEALGKIKVREGGEVSPEDILGEGWVSAGFATVHLAEGLGENPQKSKQRLLKKEGGTVFRGELLAKRLTMWGWGKRLVTSPVDGVIDYYDEEKGDLKVKLLPKRQQLVSGAYGVVEKVNQARGEVVIKTLAWEIYGLFGSGKERSGLLSVLGSAETLVGATQLDSSHTGRIVVGGGIVFVEGLRKAVTLKVSGVVTGGINAKDFRAIAGGELDFSHDKMVDVGVSVVVAEGFGPIPIGEDIFPILLHHQNRFAVIDGNLAKLVLPSIDPDSIIEVRKAALPPHMVGEEVRELREARVEVGSRVRIVAPPFLGRQGVVVSIDHTPTLLPSGVKTVLLTVETQHRKIYLPYNNIELVGG